MYTAYMYILNILTFSAFDSIKEDRELTGENTSQEAGTVVPSTCTKRSRALQMALPPTLIVKETNCTYSCQEN